MKLLIAIDGPAGSGKSTVSKLAAKKLGLKYVNTGAMYRAAALKAVRKGIKDDDEKGLEALLKNTQITMNQNSILLDGEDITAAIREPKMGLLASTYSRSGTVRKQLVHLQRKMGKNGGVIMEGRDIGTVVFPEADLKIYLDASVEVRARRRTTELKNKKVDFKNTLDEVKKRDSQDSKRKLAPLKPARDAIVIDTTNIGIEEVVSLILKKIREEDSLQSVGPLTR